MRKKWYEKKWPIVLATGMIVVGGFIFNPQYVTNFFSGFLSMLLLLAGAGLTAILFYQKFVAKYTPETMVVIWLTHCLLSSVFGFLISQCFYF